MCSLKRNFDSEKMSYLHYSKVNDLLKFTKEFKSRFNYIR